MYVQYAEVASSKNSGFDWDPDNIGHVGRHRVSQEEFEQVLQNSPVYLGMDVDPSSGEERHTEIGHTNAGRVLVVCWTLRGKAVRPVTAWRASRRERDEYFGQR
jgi:uncharacterized protein